MTAFAASMMITASSFTASSEGHAVALQRKATAEYRRISSVFGHASLRDDLRHLAHSCSAEGWDGHGALPADPASVRDANLLLDATPPAAEGVSLSVGVEPDGQVTIEWHKSRSWTLSVSVSGTGELHYAALLGSSTAYGTELFDPAAGLPEAIQRLIRRVQSA